MICKRSFFLPPCVKPILVFFVVVLLCGVKVEGVMKPEIGGDTLSTLRILYRLCFVPGDHNDKIAKKFFGCYDYAPGKPLFVMCQKKVIGQILNTEAAIDVSCSPQGLLKIPQYARCIQRAFKKAGLSMPIAVTKVNVCQGKVLGI